MTFAEEKAQALTGADPARVWLPIDEANPERAFVAGLFAGGTPGIYEDKPPIGGLRVRLSSQVDSAWVARVCRTLSAIPGVKLAGEVYRDRARSLEIHLAAPPVRNVPELSRVRLAQRQAMAAVIQLLSSELRKLP